MADIMTSVNNLKHKMGNTLSKSQDLDIYSNAAEFDPEEMELWSTSSPKNVIK